MLDEARKKTSQQIHTLLKPQGMVLITVLLFILILAGLAISSLDTSWLELQMSRNWRDQVASFAAAETALHAGEMAVLQRGSTLHCYYPEADDSLPFKSKAWWCSSATCQDGQSQGRYTVEFIVSEPCVQVRDSETGSDFYRITAVAVDENSSSVTYLQSYLAKPSDKKVQCTDPEKHVINRGRQSWVQL
jgi:Tfp pilus assembly protein PilX